MVLLREVMIFLVIRRRDVVPTEAVNKNRAGVSEREMMMIRDAIKRCKDDLD